MGHIIKLIVQGAEREETCVKGSAEGGVARKRKQKQKPLKSDYMWQAVNALRDSLKRAPSQG